MLIIILSSSFHSTSFIQFTMSPDLGANGVVDPSDTDGDDGKSWFQSILMFLTWIGLFFLILLVQTTVIYVYKFFFGIGREATEAESLSNYDGDGVNSSTKGDVKDSKKVK